jgi:hypothetical protein
MLFKFLTEALFKRLLHLIGCLHLTFIYLFYLNVLRPNLAKVKATCKVPLLWRFTIILLCLLHLFRTFQKDIEFTVFIMFHLPWYIQYEFIIKSEFCIFHTNWCMQVTVRNFDMCALPAEVSDCTVTSIYHRFPASSRCLSPIFASMSNLDHHKQ